MSDLKYLDKKLARVAVDFSATRAIDSAYTFDAADINETLDEVATAVANASWHVITTEGSSE